LAQVTATVCSERGHSCAARCAAMGQTTPGHVACSEQICHAVEVFEINPPFAAVDTANCLLLRASRDGDLESIRKALRDGASIDARVPVFIRIGFSDPDYGDPSLDQNGRILEEPMDSETQNTTALSLTPLMHAAQEGHLEAVKLLIHHGAQINLYEEDGMQALHFGAISGSVDCFRILLGAGANPVAKDHFGRDPLDYVPLEQIVSSPSKQEWLQLFKEATCWSTPVCQISAFSGHAETGGRSTMSARQTMKLSKPATTLGIDGKLSTDGETDDTSESIRSATTLSAEEGVEEACKESKILWATGTEQDTEERFGPRRNAMTIRVEKDLAAAKMEALQKVKRRFSVDSDSTMSSIDSENHFIVADNLWGRVKTARCSD